MIDIGPYATLLPEILTAAGGMFLVLLVSFSRSPRSQLRTQIPWISIAILLLALLSIFSFGSSSGGPLPENYLFVTDSFSRAFRGVFLLVALLITLSVPSFKNREGLVQDEIYPLIHFLYLGMALMAGSQDLLCTFIGLEIVSIGSYILLGLQRSDLRSNEAAWKYFLLGSASSAILLYGIALIYGATGTTAYRLIFSQGLSLSSSSPVFLIYSGLILFFVGLAFKLALVPFHSWVTDVYEGSPALWAGFLSTGPKAAVLAVLLRFFLVAVSPVFSWEHYLIWMAVASMIVGNLAALSQNNLKRMLAYSSIAHGGYMLPALFLEKGTAYSSIFLYIMAYVFMNLGSFLILALLNQKGEYQSTLSDLSGLSERHPLLAGALSLFLLSLIGIPLTGGFTAKLYLFGSVLKQGMVGIVVIAFLNSAVSAYYYLRPLVYMYMQPPKEESSPEESLPFPLGTRIAIGIAVAGVLWLGVVPSYWLSFAEKISLTFR